MEDIMGKLYTVLDERLRQFIFEQPVFFVATSPCLPADGSGGHVNVSPKGYRDTFEILGPRTVAYLDLTGSGAETIAHLRQNGRITIMFCSFGATPKILRIYGTGRAVLPDDPDWPELAARFRARLEDDGQGTARDGQRAIIVVEADRIADSCGYSVPVMELQEERDLLGRWAERKSVSPLGQLTVPGRALSVLKVVAPS
jgi:Pyridoxamine 5'-phosphate oxidase